MITASLPQLPMSNHKETYQDLADLFNVVRNLISQINAGGLLDLQVPEAQRSMAYVGLTAMSQRQRVYAPAGVAIAYGELVNFYADGPVLRVRLANASSPTTQAHGISETVGVVPVNGTVSVVLPGAFVTSVANLIPGTVYYTSTTPGAMQNIAPAANKQVVGLALTNNGLVLNMEYL